MGITGIYFDNAATTKPSDMALGIIEEMNTLYWGNPSSNHDMGLAVRKKFAKARKQVADFINCSPDEIFFCSSGTEANNLIIQGMYKGIREEVAKKWNNGGRSFKAPQMIFTTTSREHPSVRNIVKSDFFDNYSGSALYTNIDMESKDKLLEHINSEVDKDFFYQPNPAGLLVSIMMANNETGVINNIKEICEIVHRQGGYMHTDATAYIPHLPVDVKDLGVDMLTFSGHKLGVPRGVGVLYIKEGTPYTPIIYGGHQEGGIIPGTENTALICALGAEVSILGDMYFEIADIERFFQKEFRKALDYATDGICKYRINCDDHEKIDAIISVTFDGINASMLLELLNERGVYCSSGSACSSGENESSPVLKAFGLSDEEARSTIRFSLSWKENTGVQIEEFKSILRRCLKDIKMLTDR